MMNNTNALYTWAMDRQAELQREATERRMIRESRHANLPAKLRLRWPLVRQHDESKAA